MIGGIGIAIAVAYKLVREKIDQKPIDPNTPQSVSFFNKAAEDKDPIAQYSNLSDAVQHGDAKKDTIQDDFDDEDEDI